jgi:hypothetical protein
VAGLQGSAGIEPRLQAIETALDAITKELGALRSAISKQAPARRRTAAKKPAAGSS